MSNANADIGDKVNQHYDITGWSPDQVNAARHRGELRDLMAGKKPGEAIANADLDDKTNQHADITGWEPDQINAARRRGELRDLMAGRVTVNSDIDDKTNQHIPTDEESNA